MLISLVDAFLSLACLGCFLGIMSQADKGNIKAVNNIAILGIFVMLFMSFAAHSRGYELGSQGFVYDMEKHEWVQKNQQRKP